LSLYKVLLQEVDYLDIKKDKVDSEITNLLNDLKTNKDLLLDKNSESSGSESNPSEDELDNKELKSFSKKKKKK
jgi:hypothetical protein